MRRTLLGVALCALVFFSGCKRAAPAVEYAPIGTFREVMKSVVEPNANFIWGSVSTVITSKGTEKKMPRTDEDWDELHKHAIALVEATNLLLIPNRHVAKPNEKADNPDYERDPKVVDAMLAKDRPAFLKHVGALREASLKMLTLVEAKDVQGIDANGEVLDKACEDCHTTYWYIPDK
jgi:cytochrome c556